MVGSFVSGRISLKSLIDAIKLEVNTPRADDYLHFSTDLRMLGILVSLGYMVFLLLISLG